MLDLNYFFHFVLQRRFAVKHILHHELNHWQESVKLVVRKHLFCWAGTRNATSRRRTTPEQALRDDYWSCSGAPVRVPLRWDSRGHAPAV